MHVIDNSWVFREKLNADGTVKLQRSGLVAQGCSQEEGIDYLETSGQDRNHQDCSSYCHGVSMGYQANGCS